jgi:hypothetical protein
MVDETKRGDEPKVATRSVPRPASAPAKEEDKALEAAKTKVSDAVKNIADQTKDSGAFFSLCQVDGVNQVRVAFDEDSKKKPRERQAIEKAVDALNTTITGLKLQGGVSSYPSVKDGKLSVTFK